MHFLSIFIFVHFSLLFFSASNCQPRSKNKGNRSKNAMASVVDQFNESLTLNDTSQAKGIKQSVAKSAFFKNNI